MSELGLALLCAVLADCNHDRMWTGETRIALYVPIHCARSQVDKKFLDPRYYYYYLPVDNVKYCRCMILFPCFLHFHPHISNNAATSIPSPMSLLLLMSGMEQRNNVMHEIFLDKRTTQTFIHVRVERAL